MILCYHGVSQLDEHHWSDLYNAPEHLWNRLEHLRAGGYEILGLDEALARLRDRDLPPRAVALTFDDGFSDFATIAAPIMAQFDVPSTVYLTSYYVERELPVFDPALSYVLWKARGKAFRAPGASEATIIPGNALEPAFLRLHRGILALTREEGWSTEEKHEYLQLTADRLSVDLDRMMRHRMFFLMTPAQVQSLDPRLVTVQMHTHRHRLPLSGSSLRQEIEENAQRIEQWRPHAGKPQHFCYPSGDYDQLAMERLRELGVQSATTGQTGLVSWTDDLLSLPRFTDTHAVSEAKFDACVSGTGEFVRRIRTPPLRRGKPSSHVEWTRPALEVIPQGEEPPVRGVLARRMLAAQEVGVEARRPAAEAERPVPVSRELGQRPVAVVRKRRARERQLER